MTTIPDVEGVLKLVPEGMLIGDTWVEAASGRRLQVENPATEEIIASVPDADSDDARAALAAAAAAQPGWAVTPPRERSEILYRAFQMLTTRADQLALLITLENGKPLAEAKGEVLYAAEFLRWFSEEAVRADGRYTVAPNGQSRIVVMKQAVGPCLFITPWNFPAAMIARKAGPALAAGCTVVVKPAEETPLTALVVAAIMREAGVPAGVINVVTTSRPADIVGALLTDPRLRKVSFTGSTEVGRLVLKGAADQVLRVSMELGGNAPFIVLDDADLDAALDGAMIAKMRNVGEACTAANRFYVARRLADDFANGLAERMARLTVGPGTDPSVQVGPLINAEGRAKVADLVDDMVSKGGRVVCGGGAIDGKGYFYRPSVITAVSADARVLREEIFGPVAPIVSFTDDADALRMANDSEFGLVAYVYTRDVGRAFRFAEGLEAGMVGLNTGLVSNPAAPFGGVKQSGLGREGGKEGIEEFLETKYVALNY